MLKLNDPYFDSLLKKKNNKNKKKNKKNKTKQNNTHSHTHAAMQCKNFQLIVCQFYTVVDWIFSLIM